MRILHISTRLILGGSQENTILSCEGQARLGHDVHLAFGPIYGPEGSLLERVEAFNRRAEPITTPSTTGKHNAASTSSPARTARITTHTVPNLVREISPLADLRAYRELRRLIRELKPEVVHTHSSKAGVLGRWAAWDEYSRDIAMDPAPAQDVFLWGCRIVHTIHGPPFMPIEPNAGLAQRLKVRLNNRLYTHAERFAAKRCHAIVSVADAMTREFLRRGIGRPELYRTVYSGMETARFLQSEPGEGRETMRTELGLSPRDFVIGTVGRLAQHKGHDDILDALGPDLREHPDWKLLWVGDGWWRERLIAKAAEIGARPEQIILTGLVPPERVPAMMRAMDVLVHASSREGLPRTVPQSQLCGVVPIAYACDGTPEAIIDRAADATHATGMLIPTGDVHALRDAVRWCADPANHAELRAIASRARDAAAARFDAATMVRELEYVYETPRGDTAAVYAVPKNV